MESDLGKLFIGGISWDTDEERLKDYFRKYGEVVEAVIMRDRATGRARGFGFVVFADPAVAERVIMDKHMIDGRTVSCFFANTYFLCRGLIGILLVFLFDARECSLLDFWYCSQLDSEPTFFRLSCRLDSFVIIALCDSVSLSLSPAKYQRV